MDSDLNWWRYVRFGIGIYEKGARRFSGLVALSNIYVGVIAGKGSALKRYRGAVPLALLVARWWPGSRVARVVNKGVIG